MATQLLISPTRPGTVSITATSTVITGIGTNFLVSDIGKEIIFRSSQGDIVRVISSFTSTTIIGVSVALDITESGLFYSYDLFNLDLHDGFPYSINFAIADIRQPDNRNATFTKTISIPGTKDNNIIFTHIFEIDESGGYNPNIRADALILCDTDQVVRGNLQLIQINRLQEKIEYEIQITGKTGNLFMEIGDKTLQDLDWTAIEHAPTKANQVTSWAATVGTGYVYPLISNGLQTLSSATFKAEDMVLNVYAKQILDYIFVQAGYSYSSTFLNSDLFKRLTIPCPIRDGADVTINWTWDINTGGGGGATDMTVQLMRWNSETNIIEIIDGPYVLAVTGSGGGDDNFPFTTDMRLNSFDRVWMEYGITSLAISITNDTHIEIIYNDPDNNLVVDGSFWATTNYVSSGTGLAGVSGPFPTTMVHMIMINDGPTLPAYDPNNTWNTSTSVHTVPYGTVKSKIPKNIKQKDFFKSLISMFNLYVEPDPFLHNVLRIEPRNDYYAAGSVVDWTSKLDMSNSIEITPMGDLDWKQYLFSYNKDDDYYNKLYNNEFKEVYGSAEIRIVNDFISEKKNIGIIFAPTPSVALPGALVLPTIISEGSGQIPDDYPESIIRILYYAGMITGDWTHTEYSTGSTTHTTYPYCGHLDDPQTPTLDILWDQPNKIYWTMSDITLYTNNNLYNTYWADFIGEISDKDSKIITAYFRLSTLDIYQLDFRDTYFIDGHYLRLNKVYDYNPDVEQVTKCEFIKIAAPVPVTSNNIQVRNGNNINAPIISPAYSEAIVNPGAALDYSAVDSETFTHQRTLILGSGTPSALTITLPDAPEVGTQFIINNNAATKSNITIASNTAAIANLYTGSYPTYYVALPNTSITLVYSAGVWQKLPKYDSIGYSEYFDISVDSGFDHTDYYNLFNVSTVNLCVKTATNNLILDITLDPNAPIGSIANIAIYRQTGGTWNTITVNNLETWGFIASFGQPDVGKITNLLTAVRMDGLPNSLWAAVSFVNIN